MRTKEISYYLKRGSSIADVGLVRTSLLRAGWSRVKAFLFSRSEQSMSDVSFPHR